MPMNDSPKQPLAKGWDRILDILARHDLAGAIRTIRRRRKQPLAKGWPPIHTTTAVNKPLRRGAGSRREPT